MTHSAKTLGTHLPPRDRRSGRRILTLRNAGKVGLVMLALLTVFVIGSNWLDRSPGRNGRLVQQQLPPAPVAKFQLRPIVEGSIPDTEHGDAMSLDAAARSQYLGADPLALKKEAETKAANERAKAAEQSFGVTPAEAPIHNGQHIAIVGDANGVAVVKK
jgi:hypothetical protein